MGEKKSHEFGEEQRLLVAKWVFLLLPRRSIFRSDPSEKVKPLIRKHLEGLGVRDEDLVAILKELSDQYYETTPVKKRGQGRSKRAKTKNGIRDLRQNQQLYRSLQSQQNGRCATCGIELEPSIETLDHRIPWRLVGDVSDGSNYQILCKTCNTGKTSWLSSFQSPRCLNWEYSSEAEEKPHAETRYLVLAQRGHCEKCKCSDGPQESRLLVLPKTETGLFVADNLNVFCERHIPRGADSSKTW